MIPAVGNPRLEWGVASQASPGENRSGDLHVLEQGPWGSLAAVVDGLGHGEEAAAAAEIASEILRHGADEPLAGLVKRCHQALKLTRGAVMTVVSL